MRKVGSFLASRMILGMIVVALAQLAGVGTAAAAADSPTVTPATGGGGAPIVVGHFGLDAALPPGTAPGLDAIGYEAVEYFIEGGAHSYTTGTPLTSDGRWNDVSASPTTVPYKTRVIAHTPVDKSKFNGTVYVEWMNVSGAADASPDWMHSHVEVARQGAAYVSVSAQFLGVLWLQCGPPAGPPCLVPIPGDPARYGSLLHPSDSFSYDIFSQVGQAVWDGALLGTLVPKRVIALGESQSAGRLATYVNGIHPLVDVYDGFIVHSRGPGGAPLSQTPLPSIPVQFTEIRSDIDTPVIGFQAQGDQGSSGLLVRQDETPGGNYRLWEVAGTAHFDEYGLTIGNFDVGDGGGEIANLAALQNPNATPSPGIIECAVGVNAGPMHWVIQAAVRRMHQWVRFGIAPPIAPRLQASSAPGVIPAVFEVDEHGNALGGIRTPYVDVPVATLTGTGNAPAPGAPPQSQFCGAFGSTIPFDDDKIAELYPHHAVFSLKYLISSLEAVHSRYLLLPDALHLIQAAAESDIGQ